MIGGDIRSRVLWVAVLPVTLVAVLLATVFIFGRLGDMNEAHAQRARSLARQLASASEYSLFSGNADHLQAVATGALREPDVRAVRIADVQHKVLAQAGQWDNPLPALSGRELAWTDESGEQDVLLQPIWAGQLKLDDLFESGATNTPQLLGHVVLELSRSGVSRREREMLLTGLVVTLAGLLLGIGLALRISRGVLEPIRRVSTMIGRIGGGQLEARAEVLPDDPLRELQQGLNQMAARLQQGRDELEERIELATLALRARTEEAESATLAKSRFLAAASHDLRQPVHALGLFVARLAQLPHDAQTTHLVSHLDASVNALQDLLDALLDISRLEAGKVRVQARTFALREVLPPLRDQMLEQARDKGLTLRLRPADLWVHSDPALLHRILLNLLGNAVRYTHHGGVLVGCRPSRGGSHVRIEVWDTGIGIASEHQEDVFREFYQVGNTERDRQKGLGLGLNIVARTAQLLGHELRLCSRPGQGSRFSIELPRGEPATASAVPLSEPAGVDELRGATVLLIEDDLLAGQALDILLRSWGCRVALVEGLAQALATLENAAYPDVVVSDYRLREGENGIDTVRALRVAWEHDVPACLMSGDTDVDLMQTARQAGLTLLHKPVRPAKLRSLLRSLLRGAATSQSPTTDIPVD